MRILQSVWVVLLSGGFALGILNLPATAGAVFCPDPSHACATAT